jgi:hypothetical protein
MPLGSTQILTAVTTRNISWVGRRGRGVKAAGADCLENWEPQTPGTFRICTGIAVPCEIVNPLTPNDLYISRTAPLTSKRCILYIYSTNIGTEYFKHALYSPFFSFFKMQCVS